MPLSKASYAFHSFHPGLCESLVPLFFSLTVDTIERGKEKS